jgi:hypothetical protein
VCQPASARSLTCFVGHGLTCVTAPIRNHLPPWLCLSAILTLDFSKPALSLVRCSPRPSQSSTAKIGALSRESNRRIESTWRIESRAKSWFFPLPTGCSTVTWNFTRGLSGNVVGAQFVLNVGFTPDAGSLEQVLPSQIGELS